MNSIYTMSDEQILQLASSANHMLGVHDGGRLTTHLNDGTDIAHVVLKFARALLASQQSAQSDADTEKKIKPSPQHVWMHLLEIMHADNGGAFTASTDDFREAYSYLVSLIEDGYFQDDPTDFDSEYWLAAAGEEEQAILHFSTAYAGLSHILNRIFDRPEVGSASSDVAAVPNPGPEDEPQIRATLEHLLNRHGNASYTCGANNNPETYDEMLKRSSAARHELEEFVIGLLHRKSAAHTAQPPVQKEVQFTTGHCEYKKQPGGCLHHNVHCGYPTCDRRDAPTAQPQADGVKR